MIASTSLKWQLPHLLDKSLGPASRKALTSSNNRLRRSSFHRNDERYVEALLPILISDEIENTVLLVL